MIAEGIISVSLAMLKFYIDLCVCAPQYLSAWTLIGPKVSDSSLYIYVQDINNPNYLVIHQKSLISRNFTGINKPAIPNRNKLTTTIYIFMH